MLTVKMCGERKFWTFRGRHPAIFPPRARRPSNEEVPAEEEGGEEEGPCCHFHATLLFCEYRSNPTNKQGRGFDRRELPVSWERAAPPVSSTPRAWLASFHQRNTTDIHVYITKELFKMNPFRFIFVFHTVWITLSWFMSLKILNLMPFIEKST